MNGAVITTDGLVGLMIGLALGWIYCEVFRAFRRRKKPKKPELKLISFEWVPHGGGEAIINVARGEQISAWRGSGTVWHRLPDGDRAAPWLEAWLCDRWTAARWARHAKREEDWDREVGKKESRPTGEGRSDA